MLYELENLTRVFAQRTVLHIPKLTFKKERLYGLLGPNGSGKSTLLNILAFLDQPSTGQFRFQGSMPEYNDAGLLDLRRRVTLVDQYPIFFSASVFKNLEFGLKIRKIGAGQRRSVIEQALEMVGMEDFRQARADTLSGGENKRLALARALALRPEVLLCDEPFANVDIESQERIFEILASCGREQGVSVIFSSHDRPQAERLANHTLYLANGSLAVREEEKVFSCSLSQNREGSLVVDLQQGTAPPFPATVKAVMQHGKKIRLHLDAGQKIRVELSREEYLALPPLVGQNITVQGCCQTNSSP